MALPIGLFSKKAKVSQPTAAELIKHFEEFISYCNDNSLYATKTLWIAYLGLYRELYNSYLVDGKNMYLNDVEFNDRVTVIKKIESFIEAGLNETLLSAKYPTGAIFSLKNGHGWSDKQEAPSSFNFNFDGFGPTKTPKTDAKKDVTVTSSGTNPL